MNPFESVTLSFSEMPNVAVSISYTSTVAAPVVSSQISVTPTDLTIKTIVGTVAYMGTENGWGRA